MVLQVDTNFSEQHVACIFRADPEDGMFLQKGRATVQEVTPRLPTATSRVRSQSRPRGIFGEQNGIETAFLAVLQFPLPIHIQPAASHSLIILSSAL
jgi:hypothetical protein